MNVLSICPCCSYKMLHHIRNRYEYWFCRHCWTEMPDLENQIKAETHKKPQIINLSTSSMTVKQLLSVS